MKNYLFFIFSLCILASFASCQEEDFGVTSEEVAASAYANNFIKEYGPIAADQDWGFKPTSFIGTRAGEESYYHYRFTPQSKTHWDIYKTITAQDKNRWDMEIEIGPTWWVPEEDKTFAAANYQGHVQQPEKDYVNQYLIDHKDQGDTSCGLDSYLIYDLGNLNQGDNLGHMDQLSFDNVHFQAYNNGSSEFDYYVTNTAISDPWYRNSRTSEEIHNHYRFYMIPGYGLYLCFDYPDANDGTYDKIYNDWVLKIQPGDMSRSKTARRVFCEDLGNTHDWDFNDVVYDYIQYTDNVAQIKIYAVCGTLPIYFTINGKIVKLSLTEIGAGILNWSWTESDEIHRLLGNKKKPDNTYDQIPYSANARATYYVKCSDIMDLGIMRETDGGKPWYCIPSKQTGKVPFMIACPVGTTPSPEDVDIKTTYTKFSKYPSNPYIIWWQ